jgi:hypothetical protein
MSDLGFELDFDLGAAFEDSGKKEKSRKPITCDCCGKVISQSLKRSEVTLFRRALSESRLLEVLPYEFDTASSYHVISGGDVDSLSYLKHVIRQQRLDFCLLSSWCMALDDVEQLRDWITAGKIKRLDCYVGEIFPGSYEREYRALCEVVRLCSGRVCIFRNHAKIFAGIGDKFSFAIESSSNINTNPRTEQTSIFFGSDIFKFYKDFFDGIKSFDN